MDVHNDSHNNYADRHDIVIEDETHFLHNDELHCNLQVRRYSKSV